MIVLLLYIIWFIIFIDALACKKLSSSCSWSRWSLFSFVFDYKMKSSENVKGKCLNVTIAFVQSSGVLSTLKVYLSVVLKLMCVVTFHLCDCVTMNETNEVQQKQRPIQISDLLSVGALEDFSGFCMLTSERRQQTTNSPTLFCIQNQLIPIKIITKLSFLWLFCNTSIQFIEHTVQ